MWSENRSTPSSPPKRWGFKSHVSTDCQEKGYKTYLIYADANLVNYSVLMLLDSFGQPKATSSEEGKEDF